MKKKDLIFIIISAVVSAIIGFALQKGLEKLDKKNERT